MAPERERTTGQTYRRWFTTWPSTHVNAGKTVEVLALPDPVRDAARGVVEGWDRWQLESGPGLRVNTAVGRHRTREAIGRLRAALEESEHE